MLLVCSSGSQHLRHNIVWGEGGLKGQARGAKWDHSDEIGGKKGECINNFVADCNTNSCQASKDLVKLGNWGDFVIFKEKFASVQTLQNF